MTPYLADPDVTLYHGDALAVLPELEAESVDCVVTSPPYWGLRDYGTPGQLGLEPTPEEYVARMVEVFREVRRVLAAHGTVWLNLGDSYNSRLDGSHGGWNGSSPEPQVVDKRGPTNAWTGTVRRLAQKNLVGIPWRVAFALQDDGWILRSDIIWSKPNPMPESVTDRPTKAHEYVFLLSKQPRYFFDQEAVREPHESTRWGGRYHSQNPDGKYTPDSDVRIAAASKARADRPAFDHYPHGGRNIRSVWEIATQPYPDAHFATFPEELARRCIAAGCPEAVCRVCGKARERIVSATYDNEGRTTNGPRSLEQRHETAGFPVRKVKTTSTEGFTDCGHSDYRPGIVLDPFIGSGTVAYVARKLGRHSIGIDLNESYLALAAKRLQQQSLFAEV